MSFYASTRGNQSTLLPTKTQWGNPFYELLFTPTVEVKKAYNKAGSEAKGQPYHDDQEQLFITREITAKEVKQILARLDPKIVFYPEDEYYSLVEELRFPPALPELIAQAYKESKLASKKWLPEKFDCDDFAKVMNGSVSNANYSTDNKYSLCFGTMTGYNSKGQGHAFNIYVNTNGQVRFFEPQTGEIDISLWDYSTKRVVRM